MLKKYLNLAIVSGGVLLCQIVAYSFWRFWPERINRTSQDVFKFPNLDLRFILALFILIYLYRLLARPIGLLFLTIGLLSNYLSLLHYGFFLDYIPLHFYYTNLEDIAIFFGILHLIFHLGNIKPLFKLFF